MLLKPKYRPLFQKIESWGNIEKAYEDIITYAPGRLPMLTIIKFIRREGIDKKVYACTRFHHERLVLTIYNPAEFGRESLTIQFDNALKRWHFNYRSLPYAPEVDRYYNEEQGPEKLAQFIDWLKW